MARQVPRKLTSIPDAGQPASLTSRLFETRRLSVELASRLSAEDMTAQAMEDASPTKWHLAHVTWFFENFILVHHLPGYRVFDESFAYCFNSYYESQGPRQPRPSRGILTRPSSESVFAYRTYVDEALERLLARDGADKGEIDRLIEIGINHEQQHQELMLTDILALFAQNPLRPAYRDSAATSVGEEPEPYRWILFPGGIRNVGYEVDGFSWDNEKMPHGVLLRPYKLADRLVTNAEWREFIDDGGYRQATLWMADGWATINREGWQAPEYWEQRDDEYLQMSLEGLQPLNPAAPVCHVSYYEADAFARWAGKRLPSEFEWEVAAAGLPIAGNTLSTRALRPLPAQPSAEDRLRQMFGDVWEWTQSAYLPYPGFQTAEGALGEYNGKFMVSQHVLRGASCATPGGHSRPTYRNFFYPHQRWQFSGVRLAAEKD